MTSLNIDESFEYPRQSDLDESEELNPFQFDLNQEKMNWQLVDEHFDLILKNPNYYLNTCQSSIKSLLQIKRFILQVQEEHNLFDSLRSQYESLRNKTKNHDTLLMSIERGYSKQIDELRDEIIQLKNKHSIERTEFLNEIMQLQGKLQDKQEWASTMESNLQQILEKQNQLHEINQNLVKSQQKLQKDTHLIRQLRMGGLLCHQSKLDSNFSTFEMLIASKLKSKFVGFLNLQELLFLAQSSKRLYFSLFNLKDIIPQLSYIHKKEYERKERILSHQKDQFQNLLAQVPSKHISVCLHRVFSMDYNPVESIQVTLQDCINLISGQALGLTPNQKNESHTGLTTFLQLIGQRSKVCLQQLKENPTDWAQFSNDLIFTEQEAKALSIDKGQASKQIKVKAQDIFEQLFNLGSVAASDPSLYGSYLSRMQQGFAQLFTFSTQLVNEVKQIMGLLYYLLIQYWNVLERDRITQDLMIQQKVDLENALNMKVDLLNKQSQLDEQVYQREVQIGECMVQIQKEQAKSQLLENSLEAHKNSINNHSINVKKLAQSLKEQKKKTQDIIEEHTQMIDKFIMLREKINLIG